MIVNRVLFKDERETIRIIREYTGASGMVIVIEYAGTYGKKWRVSHSGVYAVNHFYMDRTEAIKEAQFLARY